MIKKIALILFTAALISLTPEPDKEYTAKLTLNEWNLIIANQDDVPLNQRKAIIAKIAEQINKQITDTVPKKK